MRRLEELRGRIDLALVAAIVAPLIAVACGEDGARDASSARCVGAAPDKVAWGGRPAPWRFFLDGGGLPDGGGQAPAPSPGDLAPAWTLTDFQPRSCGFGATYGLDTFRGRPLVVGLWAGW